MPTKFVLARMSTFMPDGKKLIFWFDGNGKITGCVDGSRGSFDKPIANAFSLVQVQDCPFFTSSCKSVCYVHGLEKKEQEVHGKFRENSLSIRRVLANLGYQEATINEFAFWINKHCSSGFRWHVSGDIFSLEYAKFIHWVCEFTPHVSHVIYTRSFVYLEPLAGVKNLVVNLSADADNWQEALAAHEKYGFRLCYLTVKGEVPKELPRGSVIFPAYDLRGRNFPDPTKAPWWQSLSREQRQMVCPPDFFGQSEHFRCGICKKCF